MSVYHSPHSDRFHTMRRLNHIPAAFCALLFTASPLTSLALAGQSTTPTVRVERDNTVVTASCRLESNGLPIADADGNGVIQVKGRDDGERIVVDLAGLRLIGGVGTSDTLSGVGIAVSGRNVTIRNGSVQGFKVAVRAEGCDGLIIEDIDASDNYAQLLRSKPWAEDASDWLFPHANDGGAWLSQHGAGVAVRNAREVVIRRVKSHRTQNGIVLDRVNSSQIYDNDCSFLSGWGIALWRSSGNVICRNSLDFCVRGYSHGVYNRGQDSAGLLMFEQCSDNIVALNSATHSGDGIFGFAGREALGEAAKADATPDWYRERGNNRNMFLANDLSYSAAHGLEITFSFGNVIARNRFDSNAICGVWGGYSRDTVVVGNTFSANGRVMQGSERGGVNMEHAQRTLVFGNTFEDEPVGVRFWTDADEQFAKLPWAQANGMGAASNVVAANTFKGVTHPLELEAAKDTLFAGNTTEGAKAPIADAGSTGTREDATAPARTGPTDAEIDAVLAKLPGERKAVGMRENLRGREKIVMLERGPHAWDKPIMVKTHDAMDYSSYVVYGLGELRGTQVLGRAPLFSGLNRDGVTVTVASNQRGFVGPYLVNALGPGRSKLGAQGLIAPGDWATRFFEIEGSGVPSADAFARGAASQEREIVLIELDFDMRGRAPRDVVKSPDAGSISVGADRFGISSSAPMRFLPGRYRIRVLADDGVRVMLDGNAVIDRWKVGGPAAVETYELDVTEMREIPISIEYFHDGGDDGAPSRLRLWFEAINPTFLGS
jgi:hypothetical protein